MKPIRLVDVKSALRDSRFRATLPSEFESDINNFLNNPGCNCHMPFYRKVLNECKEQLQSYFPGREVNEKKGEPLAADNEWTVINCNVSELENELKNLGPGRFQLDVARWQDQVTVVVNKLDFY